MSGVDRERTCVVEAGIGQILEPGFDFGGRDPLHDARSTVGERVVSFPSNGTDAKRGFATLTIDATHPIPEDNWSAVVRFHHEAQGRTYHEASYTLAADGTFQN
jgi:hypothetical protein